MKISQTDFRPRKRSGVVPSGKPRRKIPVLRILLLLIIAFFVYIKFDSIWTGVRAMSPVSLWHRAFGGGASAAEDRTGPVWSNDSLTFTLECPLGLRGCCDRAPASGMSICREAGALMAKARARGMLSPVPSESPLRLHARADISPAGRRFFELAALQGRAGAAFALRKNSAGTWCDARQACLSEPAPKSPLALGRLMSSVGSPPAEGAGRWVSASSAVHPVLAGRVTRVDSGMGGARVRVYHGGELYTSYEPLHLATNIVPGTAVTPRTVLGDAPWLAAGYTIRVRARRAGLDLDPSDFFSVQPVSAPNESDSAASDPESP